MFIRRFNKYIISIMTALIFVFAISCSDDGGSSSKSSDNGTEAAKYGTAKYGQDKFN